MACNFQCGRTGYRRDGLLEGSQDLNVRRPDGHGGQHTQGHSRDTEQGAKWPLEGMGADQGDIEHEWYSHLRPGREYEQNESWWIRERGQIASFGPVTEPCTNWQFRLQRYRPLLDSRELIDERLLMGARTALSRKVQPLQEEIDADLLTPRQRDILRLVSIGHTNREIAEVLEISVRTVEVHRFNLMRRLNVRNVAQLLRRALQLGLLAKTFGAK